MLREGIPLIRHKARVTAECVFIRAADLDDIGTADDASGKGEIYAFVIAGSSSSSGNFVIKAPNVFVFTILEPAAK